ncbi:hypothetical protein MVEG_07435 [Podila verticillata NRRL 6337]|nr:hypothetical protein MVEG_07435 [Podila verticillata NRRL 6337]
MSSTTTTDVALATSTMSLSLLSEHSHESAVAIRNKLGELIEQGYVSIVSQSIHGRVNPGPIGPHVLGSFEVWCPIEGFARLFSWFIINRGKHSVLVHPLTKETLLDHTERAIWMG